MGPISLRALPGWKDWIRSRIEEAAAAEVWFHRIELAPDLVTPGWDDPTIGKLPNFGIPDDLTGLRVLDIGCCEGFFSFEAERRGAAEVVALDANPQALRKFAICKDALGSKINPLFGTVYDLDPKIHGTFDLVFFFGVLYHLHEQILGLKKVLSVCAGTMLMETLIFDDPRVNDLPLAKLLPHGLEVGRGREFDPSWAKEAAPEVVDKSVIWVPNAACIQGMLEHVGFQDIEILYQDLQCLACRAQSPAHQSAEAGDWDLPAMTTGI